MSLDERLRSSLGSAGELVDVPPDVDAVLADVVRRSRGRRRNHRAAGVAGVAVLALIATIGGAAVLTRDDRHPTNVAVGPSASTTTGTSPRGDALALCPSSYRFGFVPEGWSVTSPGVISGPTGTAKLTAVGTSSATTVVTHTSLVGLPATERTGGGVFETRLDGGTDPSCGGELAVVGLGGLTETDFTLIVNSIQPAYSLVDRQQFIGVWPNSDLDIAINSTELTDPEHAAIGFLVDQLGWHGGSVIDDQPAQYYDPGSRQLTVRGEPGQPDVRVVTIRLPGTGYWAVAGAETTNQGDDSGGSATITESADTPDVIRSGFADAASAQMTLYYGTQGVDLTTTDMPPVWTFELGARPDIPGALIIRWRDVSGNVVKVHATSFPPGDFAAG